MRVRSSAVVTTAFVSVVAILQSASQPSPAAGMTSAARAFLQTLTPELRQKAQLPLDSDNRFSWHYIPSTGTGGFDRRGLPLKEMSEPQRRAAIELLRAGYSEKGYTMAEAIRALEDVLVELGGSPTVRDKELYFITIFGEPGPAATWAWRYEGHHLSQHWTIVKGTATATTPQFFGANPAEIRDGPRAGTRPIAAEEDLAYELLKSLDAAQREAAIVDPKSPNDILTTNARDAAMQSDVGLTYAKMTPAQQTLLMRLIETHAGAQREPVTRERLAKLKAAGYGALKFAWMGGMDKGEGHYYRVQGPTFLIEFDNTQNRANHIHMVWRDFKGDFGRDLLAEHYRTAPHHQHNRR
jgi:hypothetical protein